MYSPEFRVGALPPRPPGFNALRPKLKMTGPPLKAPEASASAPDQRSGRIPALPYPLSGCSHASLPGVEAQSEILEASARG